MKNIWLIAFALASLANLAAVVLGNKTLIFITKPLLMPLLAVWLATETHGGPPRFLKKMVFAALGFSWLGDVLLLWGELPFFFMTGLVAFLFAHLSYIGGFSSVKNLDGGLPRRQPLWVLVIVIFAFALLWLLWAGIPEGMRLPVGIYAAVISTMTLSVVNAKENVVVKIYQTLVAGALLFMASDSLLAMNKFGYKFSAAGLLVMATYLAGQFLLVKGVRDILMPRS
jgi:uncharacterized membrane protein YhhN